MKVNHGRLCGLGSNPPGAAARYRRYDCANFTASLAMHYGLAFNIVECLLKQASELLRNAKHFDMVDRPNCVRWIRRADFNATVLVLLNHNVA